MTAHLAVSTPSNAPPDTVAALLRLQAEHVNTLSTAVTGARMLSVPMQDPDAFFDAARYEPTWFSGVPTMHQWLLAHAELYRRKAPHHRFRFVRSASSSLPPVTLHKLEALTGAPVVETYGMSERTPIAGNPMPPGARKPGTVGFALGVELDLLDAEGRSVPRGVEGEVTIRGPVAGVEPGQWFRTGDLSTRSWRTRDASPSRSTI